MIKPSVESTEQIKKRYHQRAILATKLIKGIPFVRLVGLNGSMVRGNFTALSDVDFLIISQKGRLFTTRAIVTLLLSLFSFKRSNQKIAGQICLNRWATINQLEITPHHHYHAWTFSNLEPLYAENGLYQRFYQANSWMGRFGFKVEEKKVILNNSLLIRLIKKAGEMILNSKFGDWLERILESQQTKRIRAKKENSSEEWNIKISKDELCFHLKLEAAKSKENGKNN